MYMKDKITRTRKKIALVLLTIICINTLMPSIAYALTSGPAQPETKGFQPAGVSDMVDLQSGDFKYNIPLLDIDGYPINLNYASGTGMDDEASWVGLGWSLNPGAINRQVRGVPDDMSGDDVVAEQYTKPKVTIGAKVTIKPEFFGNGIINGSFTTGIFVDSYTGIGAEVGANIGLSFGLTNDGSMTASLGAGILSNTASGVEASAKANLNVASQIDDNMTTNSGLSANLGYNTRSGLKDLTLGTSFDANLALGTFSSAGLGTDMGGSIISFNTAPINPKISIPYRTDYGSFSIDGGISAFGGYIGGGFSGYVSSRYVLNTRNVNPAYGFLYAERGKSDKKAVMDFIREKDNPIIPTLPNLAIPVQTPDLFSFTSQAGSGQFRLYRGGTGAFFDSEAKDESGSNTLGVEIGGGTYFHGSGQFYHQSTSNVTHKWDGDNDYLKNADFQDAPTTNPAADHVYFKQVGEKTVDDKTMTALLRGTTPLAVNYTGKHALATFRDSTPNFRSSLSTGVIKKTTRQLKRTEISYLTAQDAANYATEMNINSYAVIDTDFVPPAPYAKPVVETSIPRVSGARKGHHISEITVTDDGGKRMVYGVPVYNLSQDEYSYAVGDNYTLTNRNQVQGVLGSGRPGDGKGIDYYYHKESQPAYASSFLLSAILSPDYVDKTGNGISDDDLGTAIKFNYSKLHDNYRWRSPFQNATLNRCLLADADDDKASIIYGEKEIWYMHSIESKTKIAYFITKERSDGLGALDWQGSGADIAHKQRYLSEIRLYSKADMTRPIKTVKFKYSYQLCPGTPNSIAPGGGKLTLATVYFEYGNSDKGMFHPYTFSYNTAIPSYGPDSTIRYTNMSTDRWGIYKSPYEHLRFPLDNDAFPYTNQNKNVVDPAAGLWQLKQIKLPTGGVINVNYESDDYAYVQNKKAMEMVPIKRLIASVVDTTATSLDNAHGLSVSIDPGTLPPSGVDQTNWFIRTYLSGSKYMYTKVDLKLSTGLSKSKGRDSDFVPCYAEIKKVSIAPGSSTANIIFVDREDDDPRGNVTANPIIMAAWQRIKEEYPRYAYPGFDTRNDGGGFTKTITSAIGAVFSALGNLTELKENFYQKAQRRKYASQVYLDKSFVRITKADGFKLGGGARVKKIQISDSWQSMTGNTAAPAGAYGQAYDYTTTEDGRTISSGVASYEPSIGNDENPLKQPVFYIEHIKGALDNFFDLEEPFGESFFPAPSVIYGKVTVHDLDASGNPDAIQATGYIVNEYYTAKDFPVQVHVLPIKSYENKPASTFNLFGGNSIDELCVSQGYSIDVNDMAGKLKANRIFNQSGSEISSSVYYYNTDPANPNKLRNVVDIVKSDGSIDPQRVIGRDIEFFTDFREQETVNDGYNASVSLDIFPAVLFIPGIVATAHWSKNYDYKLFRSTCAVKVNQYFGVVDRVEKTQNGSEIVTQNLAFDELTGEPVVTRTQNEFNNNIYSVNLPAYWVNGGMGAAYKNLGMVLASFTTNAHGEIGNYGSYLQNGDELVNLSTQDHYWLIDNPAYSGTGNTKKLINRSGLIVPNLVSASLKVIRSGYHNMLTGSTGSIVSLNNPIQSGHLQLISNADLTSLKVINASATVYDENWAVNRECTTGQSNNVIITDSSLGNFVAQQDEGSFGTYVQLNSSASPVLHQSGFWGGLNCTTGVPRATGDNPNNFNCGLFYRSGISLPNAYNYYGYFLDPGYNQGFETCLTVSNSQYYYFGVSSYGAVSIYIDNTLVASETLATSDAVYSYVVPVYITAGSHTLRMESQVWDAPATFGLEIYQNTASEIQSGSNINTIFTTTSLVGNANVQTFGSLAGVYQYHFTYADGSRPPVCDSGSPPPVTAVLNPYVQGYLGNWRPYKTMVYQQSRSYNDIFNPARSGMDLPNAGYINSFYSYWYYGTQPSGQPGWVVNPNGSRWVTANTVTMYDKYGQQLENKDALGRYSSAKFDFNGELPAAVASNAMNREIYASSFEDAKFIPGTLTSAVCSVRDFITPETIVTIQSMANDSISHSGNYSAKLTGSVMLSTTAHAATQKSLAYLGLDANKEYITQSTTGLYPNGFEPYPGKKYIFDAWINDGAPTVKSVNSTFSLFLNGVDVPLKCKAIVEGWKLVEGTLDLSAVAPLGNVSIVLTPAGTVYIDDIRIHPFASQIKTYAYDDKTMRLMAELDENGFATFYEYDDEGLLVRVKKETERGIMTLKESRSSYKKITP